MKLHWVEGGISLAAFAWLGGETEGQLVEAMHGEPNFRHVWWPEKALAAARSVARVKLPNGSATGFLVADDVFNDQPPRL